MIFARPEAWSLLALLLVFFVLERRRRIPTGHRTALVRLFRTLALVALVAALARPVWIEPDARALRVLVVDESASVDRAESAARLAAERARIPRGDDVEVVRFARTAVLDGEDGPPRDPAWRAGSDLAAALDRAAGRIRAGRAGSIVLLSDGAATHGEPLLAAQRLARAGLPVDVRPLGRPSGRSVLQHVSLPAGVAVGATVPVDVVVRGPLAEGTVELRDLGRADSPQRVALRREAGRAGARLAFVARDSGVRTVELTLRDASGVVVDVAHEACFVREPLEVWLVAETDELAGALQRSLAAWCDPRFRVVAKRADELDAGTDLSGVAHVVLADCPRSALDATFLDALEDGVASGLGLLVGGGRRSLGPGGWAGTPLETMLPVRFVQKEERRDPSATLVIIIDTSGSMSGTRMDLAKEVARLALQRLKPHDKAGIVEFHGAKRWAAPIQPASNAVDLQRALNRLNAGGGTVILPAIEESYYGLLNVRTRTRHVLIITDGGVEQGAFEPLLRKMADHGMTASTVLVGSISHSAFLVNLAQWGRGRFYHCPDRFNLPEVIVKQPESSLMAPYVEQPAALRVADGSRLLEQIDLAALPDVRGFVETEPRPSAEVALETTAGQPMLARWHYGLGQVAVWTSELAGAWTDELALAPEFARLLAGLLREGARDGRADEPRLEARLRRDVLAAYVADEGNVEPGALIVRVRTEDGREREAPVVPAPGADLAMHPGVVFEGLAPGRIDLTVTTRDGRVVARGARHLAPDPEARVVEPDLELLARIANVTGGSVGDELSAPRPASADLGRELWPWLVAAAGIAFLLQVLLRRLDGAPARIARLGLVLAAFALPAHAQGPGPLDARQVALVERVLAGHAMASGEEALVDLERSLFERDGHLRALRAHLEAWPPERRAETPVATLLARVALRTGDLAAARAALEPLAERLDAFALATLARLHEFAGREAEAISILERAVPLAEDLQLRFALTLRRASLLLAGRDTKERGEELLRTLRIDYGDGPDLRFYVGLLAALYDRPQLLFEAPARDGEDEEGRTTFRDHLMRGTFLLREGRREDAAQEFEAALDAAPLERDRRYAQERLIAAHRAARTLDVLCERWLQDDDRSPARLDALIALLRELERPGEALELLIEKREGLEGEIPRDLQREIIALALEAGRPDDVRATYEQLIAREPQKTTWRSGLALLHLLQGHREKARDVFREALEAAEDGTARLRVSQAARELSMDEVAEGAALAAAEDASVWHRAQLTLADMAFAAGQTERAVEMLAEIETRAAGDDETLLQIADTYERFRRPDESIRILRAIADRVGSEDVTMRLAWLLEAREQSEEALTRWIALWRATEIPARRQQAEARILDLAAKEGKLADMAIDLEAKLDGGEGTPRELALVVKIYTRAHDPIAAIDVLEAHASRMGQQAVETLQFIANVHQHCDDYPNYEKTLARLQELDPENRLDYQQQIALGALERGRGRQAKRALERLREMAPDDLDAEEFAAGVLSMVELKEEAAEAYARVLARYPHRIEDHLLWANALRDAGRREQAITTFLVLLEEADQDDLFTIAVDGLLNLEAEGTILRSALRRVKERIAERPQKAFLYQLAADLEEELGNREGMTAMTSLMAIVAGERRSAVLRELMDLSADQRRPADLIDYGRSLLALGEVMPPQVYLDLGQALVQSGDLQTAERVFSRARTEGDFVTIQQRIAGYYAEARLDAQAERILRQALMARPEDVELLLEVGGLAARQGNVEQARRDHRDALDVLLRRSPAFVDEKVGDAVGGGRQRRVIRTARGSIVYFTSSAASVTGMRGGGTDEFAKLRPRVLSGFLRSLDDAGREAVAETFREELARELASLRERALLQGKIGGNPRLLRLYELVRDVAFAGERLDLVARVDELVLPAFPEDADLRKKVVGEFLERGLWDTGRALADRLQLDVPRAFPALERERLLADPAVLEEALARGEVGDALAASLLEPLWLAGREELCRRVLDAVRLDPTSKQPEIAQRVATMASHLGEQARLRDAVLARLEAVSRVDAGWEGLIVDLGKSVFRDAWAHLDEDGRRALRERLDDLCETREGLHASGLIKARRWLGARLGWETTVGREALEEELESKSGNLYQMIQVVSEAPIEHRAWLLVRALERADRVHRSQLLNVLDLQDVVFDGALREALFDAFRRAGRGAQRAGAQTQDYYLVNQILDGTTHPEIRLAFLSMLRTEKPSDPTFKLAEAMFLAERELPGFDVELLRDGALSLLRKGSLEWWESNLLNRLERSEQGLLRTTLQEAFARLEADDVWIEPVVAMRLRWLRDAGRFEEEKRLIERALAELGPKDALVQARLAVFEREGRLAEAVRFVEAGLESAERRETLVRRLPSLCERLDRPFELLRWLGESTMRNDALREYALYASLGREEEARASLRRFLADAPGYNPRFPRAERSLSAGGLEELWTASAPREDGEGEGDVQTREGLGVVSSLEGSLFAGLAGLEWARPELVRALGADPRARYDLENPLALALQLAEFEGQIDQSALAERLVRRFAEGHASPDDRRLVWLWAARRPGTFPETLWPALDAVQRQAVLGDGEELDRTALQRFARVDRALGRTERARRVFAWLLRSFERSGFGSDDEAIELLRLYVETFPVEERAALWREHLGEIEADPFAEGRAGAELATRVRIARVWGELGDEERLNAALAAVRAAVEGPHEPWMRYQGANELRRLAQWLVSRGRVDEAMEFLERSHDLEVQSGRPARFALRAFLPAPAVVPDPEALARAVLPRVRELPELERSGELSLLAFWLGRAGRLELAAEIADEVRLEGETRLAVRLARLDVDRLLGREEAALAAEVALLDEEVLPVARMPRVLAALAARDLPRADELARRAARLTDHPPVLEFALAACERAGANRDLEALRDRLARLAPR